MQDLLVGVDTGGTFTDMVLLQGGTLKVHKVLSTPADPSRAIMDGLQHLGILDDLRVLVHGSTVATNAVLEQKGVPTGLITTAGFRDVLEIGRQTRPSLYDLRKRKVPPLVQRLLRVEVNERLNERGEVMMRLDEASLKSAIEKLLEAGVEAVAVSLLFSFANPTHERIAAEMARSVGLYVSASSEVLPEFREYERTSTVVLNAYVGPLIDRYLAQLETDLPEQTILRIMQSNGGSISSKTARREAARTLLSGPAAGVVGAAFVAEASGFDQTITIDIGGTSTDVALMNNRTITETTNCKIGGHPTKLPMIDIHTVGVGGGSVAWFDAGGALRVGPISAGANPGPAAYALGGTEATVTDANVVLGRLIPEAFLGGSMQLDSNRAFEAVGRVAERMETTVEEAALGIIRVVNANMEAAIRVISVEQGSDPRDFALVAFGGAGPLHACELATALRIPRVLVPTVPGVLSALGMLVADTLRDYVRTVMLPAEQAQGAVVEVLDLLGQLAPGVVAHDNEIAQMLVQEVGGLPLALTLMGKYLKAQTYDGQPRRIRAAIEQLRDVSLRLHLGEIQSPVDRSPCLPEDTPLSLLSIIAASDQQLDEQARYTLRALSVFPPKPNSFSEEAALAISQHPVEVLDTLSDCGLLASSGEVRYTLHQTIADYARAHLIDTIVAERLVAYMVSYVEVYEYEFQELERESSNILAALTQAFVSGQQAKLVRGVNAFNPFLLERGLYDLARLHLQRAYHTALWQRDMPSIVLTLLNLGSVALQQGEYGQAEAYLRDGLAGAREIRHEEYSSRLLATLQMLAIRREEAEQLEALRDDASER